MNEAVARFLKRGKIHASEKVGKYAVVYSPGLRPDDTLFSGTVQCDHGRHADFQGAIECALALHARLVKVSPGRWHLEVQMPTQKLWSMTKKAEAERRTR